MKRVVLPKYALFKRECWHCGCVFEYSLDDVEGFGEFVSCPCCNKHNTHDAEAYGVIREEAQNEYKD